jgi:hypothetical protein
MFLWSFWYIVCIFLILFELVMIFSKIQQFTGTKNKHEITFHTYTSSTSCHWLVGQGPRHLPPRADQVKIIDGSTWWRHCSQEPTDESSIDRFASNWFKWVCGKDPAVLAEQDGGSAALVWSPELAPANFTAAAGRWSTVISSYEWF